MPIFKKERREESEARADNAASPEALGEGSQLVGVTPVMCLWERRARTETRERLRLANPLRLALSFNCNVNAFHG